MTSGLGERTPRPTHPPTVLPVLVMLLGVLLATTASADGGLPSQRPVIVSLSFGGTTFTNDDLDQTYATLPAIGLRLARRMDERAELFVGVQYGRDSGAPYDTPDFLYGKQTELRLVPITFGARLNATNSPRYLFHFGLALRSVWMSEKGPSESAEEVSEEPEYSGWGFGLRFLIGPEWRDPSGRFAAGFEAAIGPQSVVIKRGGDERDVDLSGTDMRFYLSSLF